jgi:hypothetical protein
VEQPDLDNLTPVQLHTVTLQLQLTPGDHPPKDWDWADILQLLPPGRVRLVSAQTDPQVYLVGEALEWATGDAEPAEPEAFAMDPELDQPMQVAIMAAQSNGGTGACASDYGYAMVPPAELVPYGPAAPHVLRPGQQFTLRRLTEYDSKQDTLVAGDTVWLYDVVPGHGFWRVYAAVSADKLRGYVLSET